MNWSTAFVAVSAMSLVTLIAIFASQEVAVFIAYAAMVAFMFWRA